MSTAISTIRENVRAAIDDMAQSTSDQFIGDGSTTQVSLTEVNIIIDGNGEVEEVTNNGVPTTAYTIDVNRGWITFDVAPANGNEIIIKYQFFKSYSNEELDKAIRLAVGKLVLYGFATWTLTDPDTISATLSLGEQALTATVGAIILNPYLVLSFTTGETRFSSRKTGQSGEALIKDVIATAKISGVNNDFYINVAGINNHRTLDGQEIEYNV